MGTLVKKHLGISEHELAVKRNITPLIDIILCGFFKTAIYHNTRDKKGELALKIRWQEYNVCEEAKLQ